LIGIVTLGTLISAGALGEVEVPLGITGCVFLLLSSLTVNHDDLFPRATTLLILREINQFENACYG